MVFDTARTRQLLPTDLWTATKTDAIYILVLINKKDTWYRIDYIIELLFYVRSVHSTTAPLTNSQTQTLYQVIFTRSKERQYAHTPRSSTDETTQSTYNSTELDNASGTTKPQRNVIATGCYYNPINSATKARPTRLLPLLTHIERTSKGETVGRHEQTQSINPTEPNPPCARRRGGQGRAHPRLDESDSRM